MNNQFISYQDSLKLKELGFNEPCFGYYNESGVYIQEVNKTNSSCNKPDMYGKYCTAVTKEQADKFLQHILFNT